MDSILTPNTVRKYIAENDLGIKLSKESRVDRVRWNEFLSTTEVVEEAAVPSEPQPKTSGMQVCSATMRFCGVIDIDGIAAELKRVFDGSTQGEIEISFTVKGE